MIYTPTMLSPFLVATALSVIGFERGTSDGQDWVDGQSEQTPLQVESRITFAHRTLPVSLSSDLWQDTGLAAIDSVYFEVEYLTPLAEVVGRDLLRIERVASQLKSSNIPLTNGERTDLPRVGQLRLRLGVTSEVDSTGTERYAYRITLEALVVLPDVEPSEVRAKLLLWKLEHTDSLPSAGVQFIGADITDLLGGFIRAFHTAHGKG